ncbi:MAG TPA: UDP-glucose 4-epimerase GalE [Devosiaceae bacterium]
MNVLVTGGAGYIGSHTCKALHRAGHLPVTYDNLSSGHAHAVKWGPLVVGDIADTTLLAATLGAHDCQAIIHFAAHAYVGESVGDPLKYYANNVAGTIGMIEAARIAGVKRIVFSSTCAVFGIPGLALIDEHAERRPINPYGRSKLMVETILEDCWSAYGIASMALRYFNAAGADPDGELGEEHDPETHLIPLVLQSALDPARSISVFGTDYPTPDGTCIRDYVHVSDLADAHVLALDAIDRAPGFSACNLGTGRGVSISEVVAAASRLTNRKINVRHAPRRPGDPPELVADPSRAQTELGWSARRSDLDTILSDAWAWFKSQGADAKT